MKIASLLAAGALGLSGLVVAAPAASAAPAQASAVQQAAPTAAAATVCRVAYGRTTFAASCHTRAPGTRFAALVKCSNGRWYRGLIKRQTRNFSTVSAVRCPAGKVRTSQGLRFYS